MISKFLEKIKKDNRAYDFLEKCRYNPIGVYGKYVIVNGNYFPSFIVAADTLFPEWEKPFPEWDKHKQ